MGGNALFETSCKLIVDIGVFQKGSFQKVRETENEESLRKFERPQEI